MVHDYYDDPKGEEKKGGLWKINPLFLSVILITHILLSCALKGRHPSPLTYKQSLNACQR